LKLLLDTNVLVAALLARGVCSEVFEYCIRHHVVVSSQPLLDELRRALSEKLHQRGVDVPAAVRLFEEKFTLIVPARLESATRRDRDDDVVLATALAGECSAIVTGDQDLLILDPFQGIRVLPPSAFWKWDLESKRDNLINIVRFRIRCSAQQRA
jgi:putative PIN family toxin of toxin-antitoxin system